ncbi:exonuclease SbcC [Listeria floridensis FSL S10-1187]|uniref:Nuclease SbcCD subunit C n=1 Tax=Listeria floridensis FSL S10-1187 TaxID=1265817 RepID=A0ABP3B0Q2_9LIST|nr:AAA family ATPase [Listeria floridensis]EUJ32832.1 exonuclease SbcC [Listeria floridensis FSL S10-1187]
MRPLKLTMTAFLAYKEREEIDFTKLGHERIFVISGKTGAGKSTIFDAISFALFGSANLSDRDSSTLRSDFAEADQLTSVELTFKIRNKIYFIKRNPKQEVPKARGTGMRSIGHKVELYELAENEEMKLLASSVQEVEAQMKEIIQLSVDQFRQILMIPQGEFRELLVSDSKKKEQILQRLAHTYFYKRVEDRLIEKQKELELKAKNEEAELDKILEAAFGERGSETLDEQQNRFIQREKEHEKEYSAAEKLLETAQEEAHLRAQETARAEQILADFQSFEEINSQVERLEGESKAVADLSTRLKKARKAEPLRVMDVRLAELAAKKEAERKEAQRMTQDLERAESEREQLLKEQKELSEMADRVEKWRHNLFQLEEIEPKLVQLTEKQTGQEVLRNKVASVTADFVRLEQNFEHVNQETELYTRQLESLSALEGARYQLLTEINKLEREVAELKENLKRLQKLKTWDAERKVLQTELAEIVRLETEQQEKLDAALAEETREQAAILARELKEGAACPVCGSTEHPQLAVFHGDGNQEALEGLESELERIKQERKIRDEKERQLVWQIEQWPELDIQLVEEQKKHVDELNLQLQKQNVKLAEYEAQLAQKEELAKNQEMKKQQKDKLTERMSYLQIEKEQAERELFGLETEIGILERAVPEKLRKKDEFLATKDKIQTALDQFLRREKETNDRLNEQKEQVAALLAERKNREQRAAELLEEREVGLQKFEAELGVRGFPSRDVFMAALLSETEQEELEARIRRFEQDFLLAKERQKQLSEKLEHIEKPDMALLNSAFEAAKQLQAEREQELALKREEKRRTAELKRAFEKTRVRFEEISGDYADIGLLADTAHGKNELRITFERYVLATFLDTIIARANTRLLKMTSGRFELKRKRERAKGNVQSGLELEVFDEYTGVSRHVKTLSGGESFKTSLALALALAEVVQEMAGGISLDTMFIDEGFGTLDPESLEMAIECLIETQENGRLVGIISHVPELKERISARLEVTASSDGSKTRFVGLN